MNSNEASGELTLLGVFAHPDDEQGVGGVFTRAVRDYGAKAYIVSVTSGQAGQISDPTLATPENLGEVLSRQAPGKALGLSMSPDERRLGVVYENGNFAIWETR